MTDNEPIERVVRRLRPEAEVERHEVVDSTNLRAGELAERGAAEWTVVVADRQTAGRGRLGRTWETAPRSLLFSLVLRPSGPPERAAVITLLAGAAMADACRETSGVEVRCKWPNDLVTSDGKAGGILTESRVGDGGISHVVVGVGVNLERPDVEGAAAIDADRDELLAAFLQRFHETYRPGPAFVRDVLELYRPTSDTLGRRVRATTLDGRSVEGTAVDLDERGNLVVETDDGRETIGFGEVEHLR
jgi:BirA family biotin operon repressor/biotin-[acetyl-CoA-carboxylase] ligase